LESGHLGIWLLKSGYLVIWLLRSGGALLGLCGRLANANNMSNMRRTSVDAADLRLGEVEQLVLLAVLRLESDAYAVPIRALIRREAGIELTRGSIYITLDRLEAKGLVESWLSDPIAAQGGKARRLFRLRPLGVTSLRAAKRAVDRLAAGTVVAKR
jgi:DNA-binding PadR family transcriptional regulator